MGSKPAAGRALHALVAEAVVGGALLRIAQHAIGFGGFFEFLLGFVDCPDCGRDDVRSASLR